MAAAESASCTEEIPIDYDSSFTCIDMQMIMAREVQQAETGKKSIGNLSQPTPGYSLETKPSTSYPNSVQRTDSRTDPVTDDHEPNTTQMNLALYKAAKQPDGQSFIDDLERLVNETGLSHPAVFDQVSPTGNTYLHVAASFGNAEVATRIAEISPPLIAKKNSIGETPVHLAARGGKLTTVKRILDVWKDVKNYDGERNAREWEPVSLLPRLKNDKGNTALHESLLNSLPDVALELIQADPEVALYLKNEGESPLYLAAKHGFSECVSNILSFTEELGRLIEELKAGKSPIHAAICSSNKDILRDMLQKAPEVIHFTDEKGRFPIHYAASTGYLEGVHLILDIFPHSANQKDNCGLLPIHWASINGHVSIIKKLLRHSLDPGELLDQNGRNILHFAAKYGKSEVLGYLPKDTAFEGLINMKDKEGNTPLHLAAKHWHPRAIVALTWDSRVNLKAVNNQGMTAFDTVNSEMDMVPSYQQEEYGDAETMDPELYKATIGGDLLEFVREMERLETDRHLYYLPASCIHLGPRKNTILHLATSCGHHEIVKLVCKDLPHLLDEKDARGDTALHIAARAGDAILILILTDSDYAVLALLGATNEEGNTALHEALIHGHENAARILIDKNRSLNYSVNHEGKSLLYLAAEAGYVGIISLLMDNPVGNYAVGGMLKYKSPVQAAILGKNIDVLKLLWRKDQESFHKQCEKGRNPLHYAAYSGYSDGIDFLLKNLYDLAYLRDKQGLFPIHTAASQGHVDIVQLMVEIRPDTRELLTRQAQNILHISAKSGKCRAFECLLKIPELEKLVNEKDADGNTPLHVATIHGHPKVVSCLIRDDRVILEMENKDGLTALDIAEEQMKPHMASFHKRLTWMALRVVGAPTAPSVMSATDTNLMLEEQTTTENYRDKVNVILLVATLVATVTFSAGFSMPGGYKNSDPDQGIANMLAKVKFQEFVICDSLAMYSSIVVIVMLLWAQLGDQKSMSVALKLALPLLGIALAMMAMAFMAGVYLVVNKLNWLASFVLLMGSNFVIVLVLLFLPLCFLNSSKYRTFRFVSYYPFCLMLYALGSYAENGAEE